MPQILELCGTQSLTQTDQVPVLPVNSIILLRFDPVQVLTSFLTILSRSLNAVFPDFSIFVIKVSVVAKGSLSIVLTDLLNVDLSFSINKLTCQLHKHNFSINQGLFNLKQKI